MAKQSQASKYKGELAEEYGYDRKTLVRMINEDKELLADLKELGYYKYQRLLNPKQIKCIYRHLGYPTT